MNVLQRDAKGKRRKGDERKQETERHAQGAEPTQHPSHAFTIFCAGTRAPENGTVGLSIALAAEAGLWVILRQNAAKPRVHQHVEEW
jgi:hypothetical protein